MCTFGTVARSLAQSDRKVNMAQTALATRMMQRQTLNGDGISAEGDVSDKKSRLQAFRTIYCDKSDNLKMLDKLCGGGGDAARRNIDVDYTRNIESRLTLDMEFANIDNDSGGGAAKALTPDEQDVMALGANLFSHTASTPIEATKLGDADENTVRLQAAQKYMELRSLFAKRSVAQNSFAALVGMRAAGDPGAAPYVKAVMRELGITQDDEIEKLVGKNPSYFAQMEVLTKKLYQNPLFYTELYDKPANIERKGAAMEAIGLMQDRDLYNSLLRSEAVLAVLIESKLVREQEKVMNQTGGLNPTGGQK